jgi:hypothetical protein
MENIQTTRLQQDVNLTINQASPRPMMASNLFTFLGMRLQNSFMNLNCQNFGLQNQVTTTMNGNGVVIAVCFRNQVAPLTAGAGNPTAGLTVCPQQVGQLPNGMGTAINAAPTPPSVIPGDRTLSPALPSHHF